MAGVTWIKAHLTLDEALGRGYTADDWLLNEGAGAAATRGIAMHLDDPGALVLFQYRVARVVLWQTYLLRLYIRYRSLPKFVGAVLPGVHQRNRPQGAANLPRTVRTDLHWKARHAITTHPKGMPVFIVDAPPAPRDRAASSSGDGPVPPSRCTHSDSPNSIVLFGRGGGYVRDAPVRGGTFISGDVTPFFWGRDTGQIDHRIGMTGLTDPQGGRP